MAIEAYIPFTEFCTSWPMDNHSSRFPDDYSDEAGVVGGTPNAQTVALTSFSLQTGQIILIKALSTNTGAVTISVNGGDVLPVYKFTSAGAVALSAGDLIAGRIYEYTYDGTLPGFQVLNAS